MQDYLGLDAKYSNYKDSRFVILPVPFDKTSTGKKGSAKGPEAIIEASLGMEVYDIETDSEVYKQGIFTDEPIEGELPEILVESIKKRTGELIKDNKFVTVIGGEHTVSVGAVIAYKKAYPDLSVVQLDAHADLKDEFKGSKLNHGCVMARIKDHCPAVQVGIRSMSKEEKAKLGDVFYAKDIYDNNDWHDNAIEKLSDNVYVTIDLDVFEEIESSTGTPEPGGLSYLRVLAFLKKIAETKKIVGFDIVELCPNSYHTAPDILAATLIYKFFSYIADAE